jgi:tetratricopeptide (TPR) repeat protein
LERAKQVFEQLVDREPESEPAKRKLSDVLRRMGGVAPEAPMAIEEDHAPVELVKPPAPKVRPDLEPAPPEVMAKPAAPVPPAAAAPVAAVPVAPPRVEPALDEDTQKFIAQSLTDVDLFASYGLTQKAIGLLEAILRRAPRHTPTLEKLLDFVLGAGDDRRTAELAAQLEQIHSERGDPRGAERFGELRRRFQRAAGLTDEELAGPVAHTSANPSEVAAEDETLPEIVAEPALSEFSIEEAPVELGEISATEAAAPQAEEVHEVDLSDEWASMLESQSAAAPVSPAAESAPEFEVPAEVVGGADEFAILEETESAPAVAEFHVSAEAPAVEEEAPALADISADVSGSSQPVSELHEAYELPELAAEPAVPPFPEKPTIHAAVPKAPVAPAQPPGQAPEAAPKTSEPEFELDQDYELILDPEPIVPAYDQKPPAIPVVPLEPVGQNAAPSAPASGFASDQFLSDLANEIDQLGIGELSPGFSEPAALEAASDKAAKEEEQAVSPIEVGPLKEVFDEFRAELGEMGAEDEDLETHYNLGIAFREMGLLEEAISEFQKVAKASERGRPFRYSMQCYTLLGLTFMDRGQPSIAAMWYERALLLPDIEPESTLALRYDLGVAQESAGELEAALKSFFQVYAVNIDYRDVGERIAALQKPAR